jgi:hypothetical protein
MLPKQFGTRPFFALAFGASALALASFGPASLLADTPATSSASNRAIPPAEFVKKANMRSPRISPDGKHLAYLAGSGGKEILAVIDLTNPAAPPKPIMAADEVRESGDRTMQAFRWIGNDHVVMTVIMREAIGGARPLDFRRLIAYSVSTGKIVNQAWDKAGADASNVLWVDQTKGEYLLERDAVGDNTERFGKPEVVRVDVTTGQYSMVQRTNPIVNAG